ncbi:MAG: class II aldolase/adducin family protein [Deltaproteobacteria bacterium]|nr:class II aldolase/adducin family protein [Deltaproteobacteria bacterium]
MAATAPQHTVHGTESSLAELRRQVIAIAHQLHERGWVANHDGNVTVRVGGDRLLCTPTALSKRVLHEADLIVVDGQNKVVQGGRKPFSELALHRAVYATRADVRAVVHSHTPKATALAVAGIAVEPRMLAEAVVSLGAQVPLLPYAFPNGADQVAQVKAAAVDFDVVTLGNHGVLAWGDDVEQAFLRAELVEHLAGIQLLALQLGRVTTVPDADLERLLTARAKAGLGPVGRAKRS